MILPEDQESLSRILGRDVPAGIEPEYEMRIRMFHANGHSGPLGTVGLIDMVRFLGLAPASVEKQNKEIDWRKYPADGSVRVEARFLGDWMPGVFLGFVASGTLAIRLDTDNLVRECRKDIVRLANTDTVSVSEPLPPRAAMPPAGESQPESHVSEDASVDVAPAEKEVSKVRTAPQDDLQDTVEAKNPLESLPAGQAVWVQGDDDLQDAVFVGVKTKDSVEVRVSGEESTRTVPVSAVTVLE